MRDERFRERIERVKHAASGQWLRILTDAGVSLEHLSKPNRPCPLCGGRDRFTFFRQEEGGGWYCRGCGHGDGLSLLQKWRHEGFIDTLVYLEKVLSLSPWEPQTETKSAAPVEIKREDRIRQKLETFWEEALPMEKWDKNDPAKQYLQSRHLILGSKKRSTELRSHPLLDYWETQLDDQPQHERWPAMLARVTDESGHLVSLHRTYLTPAGSKAPVSAQKKLVCSTGENGLIRLYPPEGTLGIAEGIETALAASLLFKVPVWSAVCANGFRKITVLPSVVSKLIIFGDNDQSFTGQAAAWELAHRMRRLYPDLEIEVEIPRHSGYDWHDVWCLHQRPRRIPGKS